MCIHAYLLNVYINIYEFKRTCICIHGCWQDCWQSSKFSKKGNILSYIYQQTRYQWGTDNGKEKYLKRVLSVYIYTLATELCYTSIFYYLKGKTDIKKFY